MSFCDNRRIDIIGGIRLAMSEEDIKRAAKVRWAHCVQISEFARTRNLDATPDKVNRSYEWWCRWYEGRLATGYLMRATGIRRIHVTHNT